MTTGTKQDLPTELIGVEIFSTGKWQGVGMSKPIEFTKNFISNVVRNTHRVTGKMKLPVKLGHDSRQIFAQSDGQPALGWLDNIREKGDKIIADIKEIPEVLMRSIKRGLFKHVSVEFGETEGIGIHVKGLAILGADMPAVKTLKELDQFFSEPNDINDEIKLCFSEPIISGELQMELTEKEKNDEEIRRQQIEIERRMKEIEKRELDLRFSEQKQDILSKFKSDINDGKLMPHILDKIEMDIDAQKLNFSDGSVLSFSVDTVRAIAEAAKKLETKEVLEQTEKQKFEYADEALDKKIKDIMMSSSRSYDEAADLAFSDSQLIAEYVLQANKQYGFNRI